MIHIKNKKKPLEVTVEEMRKFSLSLFETIHKSNFSNIFFAKLINNFHLLKVFFVIFNVI